MCVRVWASRDLNLAKTRLQTRHFRSSVSCSPRWRRTAKSLFRGRPTLFLNFAIEPLTDMICISGLPTLMVGLEDIGPQTSISGVPVVSGWGVDGVVAAAKLTLVAALVVGVVQLATLADGPLSESVVCVSTLADKRGSLLLTGDGANVAWHFSWVALRVWLGSDFWFSFGVGL